MKKVFIASSILSANFACLGKEIQSVLSAGADIIHFDVMDNHYVPNLTFGPMVLESLRGYGIQPIVDVHLMTTPVDDLIRKFAHCGAHYITFHPEASDDIRCSLKLIKTHGCKAGLALNPWVSLNSIKDFFDVIDTVLIMTVNPGWGGQTFIDSVCEKIHQTHSLIQKTATKIQLEVDGGIKINNIRSIASLGIDIFVIGSEIFHSADYSKTITSIKSELQTRARKIQTHRQQRPKHSK